MRGKHFLYSRFKGKRGKEGAFFFLQRWMAIKSLRCALGKTKWGRDWRAGPEGVDKDGEEEEQGIKRWRGKEAKIRWP